MLLICDSGCGCSMGNRVGQFIPGSMYASSANVQGAGGAMATKEKGQFRFPVPTQYPKTVGAFSQPDSIYNKRCAFALAAIGWASINQGVTMVMPSWGMDGYFEYPNGIRVTLLNRQVLIVRPIGYKESPALNVSLPTAE